MELSTSVVMTEVSWNLNVCCGCCMLQLLSTHADRHVVDISFLFVCLFVFLFVRTNFGNGYLGRGLS